MKATKEILELAEKEYVNSKESIRNIAKKYGVSRFIITGWLLAKGYSVYNRRAERYFNVNFFDSIDSEEKAYWLGFMYADGWINKNNTSWNIGLALKSDDLSHLLKFGKAIGKEHIVFSKVACKISLGSKHMFNTLKQYGCVERKSLILQFPKEETFTNKDLIRHFIRGYFDGDGCISYADKSHTKYSVSILGTKLFLEKLKEYANIKNKVTLKKGENVYTLQINGKTARNFLSFLYSNSTVFLERKYNRYLECCRLYEESYKSLLSKIGED